MHKNHLEAVQLTQKVAWALSSDDTEAVEVVVCPPFTALRSVGTLIEADRLAFGLGAQNCHPEPQGAYTGEVSAPMLAKLRCGYVIVGHSERRQDRKSTRLNSSHVRISYAVFCLKKKKKQRNMYSF